MAPKVHPGKSSKHPAVDIKESPAGVKLLNKKGSTGLATNNETIYITHASISQERQNDPGIVSFSHQCGKLRAR